MDGRDFIFGSFKEPNEEKDVIFFPKSNLGEGRNMLYLAMREQEMRQGWLYNYAVFLDDDIEFEITDPTYKRRYGLIGYANSSRGVARSHKTAAVQDLHLVRGRSGLDLLRDELADFEQWLRFMQPAIGSLCWGGSGCSKAFYFSSTCHTDHKFVAYHREALETLFPLPTHRDDEGCWWASQWAQSIEGSVYYRGHCTQQCAQTQETPTPRKWWHAYHK